VSVDFSAPEVAAYYAARVPHLKQRRAAEWRGACPIHHGKNDNFAVEPDTGRWFCHSTCGRGGDILELEEALKGGGFPTRKAEVLRLVGRTEPEYRHYGTRTNGISAGTSPTKPTKPAGTAGSWREIARYPYVGRDGSLLFEVIRYLKPDGGKTFKQGRPDGSGGILWNLDAIERVPYRLPKLLSAETVFLPEGERDVHTLEGWGLVASCNPGGSGNSHLYAGWADYFRNRHVVILPDNDGPGRKHAAVVAAALLSLASSVRIVELPGLPAKGDVTNWRDAGGTLEGFRELANAAAPMDAAALSELGTRWRLAGEKPVH
jgi:putative DNA primase/helicase